MGGEVAKERKEALEKEFEPLAKWLKESALKDKIEKAVITERLTETPCALVASQYGWSGNFERLQSSQRYQNQKNTFYANQKKTLEINPRHPLIKTLLAKVEASEDDEQATNIAQVMFDTAVLRSGYNLKDQVDFSKRIMQMLYKNLDIDPNTPIEEEPAEAEEAEEDEEEVDADDEEDEGEEEVVDETTTETPTEEAATEAPEAEQETHDEL